jgi:ankyrin repeat protein
MTTCNGGSFNALEYAALSGNVTGVKILFQRGWRPELLRSDDVIEYLDKATTRCQAELVESLLTLLYILPAYFCDPTSPPSIHLFKSWEKRTLDSFLNAASLGNLSVTRIFESMGFDLLEPDADGRCPYTRAIMDGNYNAVNYVLYEERRRGTGRGVKAIVDGFPLTVAAAMGTLSIAKLLVRYGARLFSEPWGPSDLIPPFAKHSRFKNLPIPRFIANSTSLDLMTHFQGKSIRMFPTPLYAAAVNGHKKMVEWLLSQGAFSDLLSPTGLIAFDVAPGQATANRIPWPEHITRTQLFFSDFSESCGSKSHPIESMVDVAYYQRPLAGAVLNGHTEVVKILLREAIEINQEDSDGLSALYLAAAMGFSEIAELLLDAGALFDKEDPWVVSQFLACASDEKRIEALKLFLQLGVSPDTVGPDKISVLSRATSCVPNPTVLTLSTGSLECMKILLRAGADVRLRDSENRTALGIACEQGGVDAASILLAAGADPNTEMLHGKPLLFHACYRGSLEIARLLLQNGAEVDSVHVDGRTPLFAACEESQAPLVELLLSNGADPNYRIGFHIPYFHFAIGNDTEFQQRVMKRYGLNFPIGTTPVMIASERGKDNIIDQLVKAGADLEATNCFGATALICASAWGREKEVRALVDAGASLQAIDKSGRSAFQHASRARYFSIVDFLLPKQQLVSASPVR